MHLLTDWQEARFCYSDDWIEQMSYNKVTTERTTTMLFGIDVSHGKEVDWTLVKRAGVRFAFYKATEFPPDRTESSIDPHLGNNAAGTAANRIHGAPYHLFFPPPRRIPGDRVYRNGPRSALFPRAGDRSRTGRLNAAARSAMRCCFSPARRGRVPRQTDHLYFRLLSGELT